MSDFFSSTRFRFTCYIYVTLSLFIPLHLEESKTNDTLIGPRLITFFFTVVAITSKMTTPQTPTFKLVLVGDGGTGKVRANLDPCGYSDIISGIEHTPPTDPKSSWQQQRD